MSIEVPANLKTIYSTSEWLDLLFKSRLTAEHKLAGTVISRTCSYSRRDRMQLSAITTYAMSRILNLGPETTEKLIQDLLGYGWLYDTGRRIGARKVFVLTMSMIPLGEPKT